MRPYSKSRIRRAFDQSAPEYHQYASFQMEIADELLERISKLGLRQACVMDFGCGAGAFSAKLARTGFFKTTLAYDISRGMAQMTAKLRNGNNVLAVAQGDVEDAPVKNNSLDLAVSNFVFQWMENHNRVFGQVASALKPGGTLIATCLGESTFHELRESVGLALKKDGRSEDSSIFHKFPTEKLLMETARDTGFDAQSEKKIYVRAYKDLFHLMRTLKRLGVQNSRGLSGLGLGRRGVMEKVAYEYDQRRPDGDGIEVTYEVIFLNAVLKRKR